MIASHVNERLCQGKESIVYLFDKQVPPKKLAKELSRYQQLNSSSRKTQTHTIRLRYPSSHIQNLPQLELQLPPTVRIATPTLERNQIRAILESFASKQFSRLIDIEGNAAFEIGTLQTRYQQSLQSL